LALLGLLMFLPLGIFVARHGQVQGHAGRAALEAQVGQPAPEALQATLTIPAGQIAVLELLTDEGGTDVPVPGSEVYAAAPVQESLDATFRWLPTPDATSQPGSQSWQVEVVTLGGAATSTGLVLPDPVAKAIGQTSLNLPLDPNRQLILMAVNPDESRPAVRLRARTIQHKLPADGSGQGRVVGTGAEWKALVADGAECSIE
jgi:hypothetical protein